MHWRINPGWILGCIASDSRDRYVTAAPAKTKRAGISPALAERSVLLALRP